MHNPTARLETFCDGVFAIAITLLILDIKVPAPETISSSHTLAHALKEHWPSWFAFLLSFFSILISWANHHNALKLINKSSTLFNFANGFFLLTIVVIPYPTSLLAEYIQTNSAPTAVMFYCFAIMLHNIAWVLFFQSMLTPQDLSKNHVARKAIQKHRIECIYGFFIYLTICAFAYWFPILALSLIAVLFIFWMFVAIKGREEDLEIT